MKRFITFMICIILAFGLVGCKGSSKSQVMEILSGEWIQYGTGDAESKKITLNSDYSAEVNGESCSWKIVSDNLEENNKLVIEVKNSKKETIDTLTVSYNYHAQDKENGFHRLSSKSSSGAFVSTKEYDIIEINKSNYENYFMLDEILEARKDTFGDYNGYFDFTRGWMLKDGLKVDHEKSNILYKFSYTVETREFDFNKDTGECKVLNAINTYTEKYSVQKNFILTNDGKYIGEVGSTQALKDPLTGKYIINGYPTNINLDGISGTLFLHK